MSLATTLNSALDLVEEKLRSRHRLRAVPAEKVSLRKLASSPRTTIQLTEQQTSRLLEIERSARTAYTA